MNFGHGVAKFSDNPFRHWVVDNYLPEDMADQLAFNFPEPTDEWYRYDNMFEMKRATDRLELMPTEHTSTFLMMNSYLFMKPLEQLTGIKGLIPDPWFRGGGLHWIGKGGLLGVHSDFNWHHKLALHRKLNVLLYLNKGYEKKYGGELQLWSQENGETKECVVSIDPLFNRLVVFETDNNSLHGHPTPWAAPTPRRSMALYYYVSSSDKPESTPSTMFRRLPNESTTPEIETLREKRNKGRL